MIQVNKPYGALSSQEMVNNVWFLIKKPNYILPDIILQTHLLVLDYNIINIIRKIHNLLSG